MAEAEGAAPASGRIDTTDAVRYLVDQVHVDANYPHYTVTCYAEPTKAQRIAHWFAAEAHITVALNDDNGTIELGVDGGMWLAERANELLPHDEFAASQFYQMHQAASAKLARWHAAAETHNDSS